MVKAIVATTKLLLLRGTRRAQYKTLSTSCGGLYSAEEEEEEEEEKPQLNKFGEADDGGGAGFRRWRQRQVVGPVWVPHPRTGIYVPQGHERVMDDVPESAASFAETYWLRINLDNADRYLL